MDLRYTGRGIRVTEEMREAAEHKLAHLTHIEPRITRFEIEIIAEHNPRLDGSKRLEGTLVIPRKTFRAHGEAPDVQKALDQLVRRLERQIRDHHGKRRTRMFRKGDGLESAHA
jgi:ribosomal subunit interface protein